MNPNHPTQPPPAPAQQAARQPVNVPASPQNNALAGYRGFVRLVDQPDVIDRFVRALGKRQANLFLASLLNTVATNQKLQECEPMSILRAAMVAASLNLVIDPNLGQAWIIPYGRKARFQIGYKGLVQLAYRTKRYEILNAVEIYLGEEVKVDRLTGKVKLSGEKTSEEIVGYIAYFKFTDKCGGLERWVYHTRQEMFDHGKRYSPSFSKPDSLWQTNFNAMALKCTLKELLSRWGYLSADMLLDEDDEDGTEDTLMRRMAAEPAAPPAPTIYHAEPEHSDPPEPEEPEIIQPEPEGPPTTAPAAQAVIDVTAIPAGDIPTTQAPLL